MTAHEVLVAVLARSNLENSARDTITQTIESAGSLATLASRYQHAWNRAAQAALQTAAEPLPPRLYEEIVNDPGASYLARVVAQASAKNVNTQRLLADAIALDDLQHLDSPAVVLATRIEDHRDLLGIPRVPPARGPLPWLPAPETGHPDWDLYLHQRAQLIVDRAKDLGSLAAAYREQYGVTDTGSLGQPPAHGSRRELAYEHARRHSQDVHPPAGRQSTPPPRLDRGGPRISR